MFPALLAILALHCGATLAQTSLSEEVEALKLRVRWLEDQNSSLIRQIRELRDLIERLKAADSETKLVSLRRDIKPDDRAKLVSSDEKASTQGPAARTGARFYGFLRLDLIRDSHRPDNSQKPFFVLSPDDPASGSQMGQFTMHPRLTRLGLDFLGPQLESLSRAKLDGKFEVDFQNGGLESRQIVRIRHAYLTLRWGDLSILAGQTWDIISPLVPAANNDTLMWNAGNPGDRRPQLRIEYAPKSGSNRWSFAGGIGLTGALDAKDVDGNGFRDGEESSRPNLQARIGYSRRLHAQEGDLAIGIWGHRAWERVARPLPAASGGSSFISHSIGADFTLPIYSNLQLRGEAWAGSNLSDFRGGIAQGINARVGSEIRSRGGWGEIGYKLAGFYTPHVGVSLDDPIDDDLPDGGRSRNLVWYIANRFDINEFFTFEFDYLRWRTDYRGLRLGIDNRFNIFLQFNLK